MFEAQNALERSLVKAATMSIIDCFSTRFVQSDIFIAQPRRGPSEKAGRVTVPSEDHPDQQDGV